MTFISVIYCGRQKLLCPLTFYVIQYFWHSTLNKQNDGLNFFSLKYFDFRQIGTMYALRDNLLVRSINITSFNFDTLDLNTFNTIST